MVQCSVIYFACVIRFVYSNMLTELFQSRWAKNPTDAPDTPVSRLGYFCFFLNWSQLELLKISDILLLFCNSSGGVSIFFNVFFSVNLGGS